MEKYYFRYYARSEEGEWYCKWDECFAMSYTDAKKIVADRNGVHEDELEPDPYHLED